MNKLKSICAIFLIASTLVFAPAVSVSSQEACIGVPDNEVGNLLRSGQILPFEQALRVQNIAKRTVLTHKVCRVNGEVAYTLNVLKGANATRIKVRARDGVLLG